MLAAALPAAAQTSQQQGGVTVIRPAPTTPDTGVRRLPPNGNAPAVPPNTAPTVQHSPTAQTPVQPILRDDGSSKVLPANAPSDVARALAGTSKLGDAEAAALRSALKAVDEGRFADATASVKGFNNPLLNRIVEWNVLRTAPKTEADFASTWRFLRDNPDWPEPELLRRQAEERIGSDTPQRDVWRYFTAFPPLTSTGYMRRMSAVAASNPPDVPKMASDTWRNATLRNSDEEDFLGKYSQYLTADDHIARFDRILREGRPQNARDLVAKLPPDYQSLANARLAMATKAADTVTILRGVAPARLNEPNIKFERLQWMRRSGNLDDAKALLVSQNPGQTEAWWNERQLIARDLLAAGRPADAYAVVVPHGQTKGVAFAEAEFLAGWIALRHLRRAADAHKHFQTLYDGAPTEHSKSRGAYWLGRTAEVSGKAPDAKEWYGRAAAFGLTFYGQLAARKLPGGSVRLPGEPSTNDADQQALSGRELVAVARYLGQTGDYERTRPFLLRLARMVTGPGETALLAQLAADLQRPDVSVTIARRASDSGVNLVGASFPVVELGNTGSIERALALALTRQESAFNAAAVSPSNALGLMQLLPSTARDVATKLGVPFIQDKLTRDPAYNVQLGSQYLADMLTRFGGSYEIAAAAYNAGPNRVAKWLETMGDPRSGKIDMIDWIEMIPFRETRNYVQRIMEGVWVYRDRLNGPFRTLPPATGRS
jgi:soluble lytic murein transglycosylase